MVDHSQKWHNGSSNRRTSSGSSDGIVDITRKLDSLVNRAMYRMGPPEYYTRMENCPPFGEKKPSPDDLINKHVEESTRRRTETKD
ncbi:hypothetical protein Tco_0464725 [Tanacetum coccineum]